MRERVRPADNPFRSARLDGLGYEPLDGPGAEELVERFRRAGSLGALVGPHGVGKTTLLEAMARVFVGEGADVRWIRLNEERRTPQWHAWRQATRGLKTRSVLVVDGAEQLPRAWWWRVRAAASSAGGLLVTMHEPGLLPMLHELLPRRAVLTPILEQLLVSSERVRCEAHAGALFAAHDGNVRDVLRALYDEYAGI